jgi:hypothetical protein
MNEPGGKHTMMFGAILNQDQEPGELSCCLTFVTQKLVGDESKQKYVKHSSCLEKG